MNEINNNMQGHSVMSDKKISFEVNPLDVNLAKIQYSLISRCEREVPENGDFAPVVEEYESKDPTKDLSNVKICCEFNRKNPGIKNSSRNLTLTFYNRDKSKQENKILYSYQVFKHFKFFY